MTRLKRLLRPMYAPIARRFRQARELRRERKRILEEVRRAISESRPVKIVIGAGPTRYDGWIATDAPAFDVRRREHWASLFPPASIDRMLAEHVFEHLTTSEFSLFLATAREYLAESGRIRVAVPDGNHPDSAYIERVRPGGTGDGADDHKSLFTARMVRKLLAEQGYGCELLEYFDGDGRFQRQTWSAEDGFVLRSAAHDARNQGGQLNYTSLIVDFWRR